MERYEREIRQSKFAELMNKHFAASAIPKAIHCLSLRLTDEYSSNAHARRQLPAPELLPLLSDNSYHHFVLSTDNILAASVVVASAVQSSVKPEKIVFHVITDKKTYAGMHSWFALNPMYPAIVEVKGIHQFDWLTRENVPVLEAVENHNGIRNYYHGNHIAGANLSDTTPRTFASKLQARSPKYISLLNHLRIYLPEVISCCTFHVISNFYLENKKVVIVEDGLHCAIIKGKYCRYAIGQTATWLSFCHDYARPGLETNKLTMGSP